jgi:hypothetical protein
VITERVCRSFRMSWPPCDKRVCYPGLYFCRLNVPSRHRRQSVARARLIARGDSLSLIDRAARLCRSPMAVDALTSRLHTRAFLYKAVLALVTYTIVSRGHGSLPPAASTHRLTTDI